MAGANRLNSKVCVTGWTAVFLLSLTASIVGDRIACPVHAQTTVTQSAASWQQASPAGLPSLCKGMPATAWSGPPNALQNSDNQYVTASLWAGQPRGVIQTLVAYNFGFSVPGSAVITGIQARIERRRTGGISCTVEQEVRLQKTTSNFSPQNKAIQTPGWPTVDAYQTYGGCNDLWGWASITPAEVNNPNFGVRLTLYRCCNICPQVVCNETRYVDHVELTVCYNVITGIQDLTFAVTTEGGFLWISGQVTVYEGMRVLLLEGATGNAPEDFVLLDTVKLPVAHGASVGTVFRFQKGIALEKVGKHLGEGTPWYFRVGVQYADGRVQYSAQRVVMGGAANFALEGRNSWTVTYRAGKLYVESPEESDWNQQLPHAFGWAVPVVVRILFHAGQVVYERVWEPALAAEGISLPLPAGLYFYQVVLPGGKVVTGQFLVNQ